jgi:hypothetical protein
MRRDAEQPFSYICNALLQIPQSDEPSPMAFTADGSLLIGTGAGLRSVTPAGCPRTPPDTTLQTEPIFAVRVHPKAQDLVYAVTDGAAPRVARSTDGGLTWAFKASLRAGDTVTALVLDDSAEDVLYVTQASVSGGSTLLVSRDGGASFSSYAEQEALALLDVESHPGSDAGAPRLWALGHDRTRASAYAVLQATAPEGPWKSVLTVNYFGGFAMDPSGVVWVGDEGGGLFRSTDGGATFGDVSPHAGVACLDFAQGSLFACTPGLAQQSALDRWDDGQQALEDVVALATVGQMVTCDAPTDVQTTCAAAWVEWQRDVVGLPPASRDAGTPREPSSTARSSGGCSTTRSAASSQGTATQCLLGAWLLLVAARRSRARA